MNFLNKFKFEIKNSLTRNSKKKKTFENMGEKKREKYSFPNSKCK